jgi:hypothetical protein
MGKLSLILSTLFILWCPFAIAAQVDFTSTDAFLKSTLKGKDQLSVEARGDLNGDGLEDWAGVIQREPASDPAQTTQLYVLLRVGQGGYHVAEKSKETPVSGAGCCWVENLEIGRSSIYVQNNAKTATTMEVTTHQFKIYQGQWRLIGAQISYHYGENHDDTIETDMNLLTGAVIEKRQKGENRPTIKSRKKKFGIYLLKDYEFDSPFRNE